MNTKLDFLHNKRLLVTGGLGFLGRWVTNMALQYGAVVKIIDRTPQKIHEHSVYTVNKDILSYDELDSLIEESDVVIHLAGSLGTEHTFSNLLSTIKDNILVTAKILESCLKTHRRAVYLTVGNDWLNPYTISKHCAANLAIMNNLECDGDFRVLKTMNVYGPWQAYSETKKIIPSFFRQSILNEPIDIYGDGNQCVDLIFAQDVAVAILLASIENNLPKDRYMEIGTSIPHRVVEVANMICELTNSKSPLRYVGKRKGEPSHSITLAKDDEFKKTTGFVPKIALKEGLGITFRWYLANLSYLKIDLGIHPQILSQYNDIESSA